MHRFPFLALIKRQFIQGLRQKRLFVFLILFIGLLAFSILSQLMNPLYVPGNRVDLFRNIVTTLTWAAFLLVPGLAASMLRQERQPNLFTQLYLTLIKPLGIVAANIVTAMAIFALFCLVSLPILSFGLFSPGVDSGEILRQIIMLNGLAFVCAIIGTFGGAASRNTGEAIFASYAIIGFCSVAGIRFLFFSSPFWGSPWLYALLVLCLAIVTSCLLLRRLPENSLLHKNLSISSAFKYSRAKTKNRFAFGLFGTVGLIPDWQNAIVGRDLRCGFTTRGNNSIWAFAISAILALSFVFYLKNYMDLRSLVGVTVTIIYICTVLTVWIVASEIFTESEEKQTRDMLRMTPMRGQYIVNGKLLSGTLAAVPIVLGILAPLPYLDVISLSNTGFSVFYCALSLLTTCWIVLCATLYASASSKNVSSTFFGGGLMAFLLLIAIPATLRSVIAAAIKPNSLAMEFSEFLSPIMGYVALTSYQRPNAWQLFLFTTGLVIYFFLGLLLIWLSGWAYQGYMRKEPTFKE